MSNDFERIWRLSLPDDWHPGYFWCVTFRIPGGVQYVEALSAAIGLLTKTKTWARDDTREGAKTVAATWEEALYERPIDVQQLDCIWLGPTVATDADRANVAAAIIQQVFIYLIQTIIDAITASQTKIQWLEARENEWQWYGFGPSAADQLGHVWDAVHTLSLTERAGYVDDCAYVSQFDGLKNFMDANPFGWLNELASWLFDWLNNTSDAIMTGLNGFAALIGGSGIISYAYDHGGGGGGSGFGATCPWVYTIDPSNILGTFVNSDFPTGSPTFLGTYVGGSGWQGTHSDNSDGNDLHSIWVQKDFGVSFDVTSVEMIFDLSKGAQQSGLFNALATFLSGSLVGLMQVDASTDPDGTGKVEAVVLTSTIDSLALQINDSYYHHGAGSDGSSLLTAVVIHGIGPNPFA